MAVARKRPKRQPTALPFNAQIAAARRNLLGDRQGYLRDYTRNVNDINRSSTNQLRTLNIQQPEVNRGILNNFAGRGLAYSSGYGTTLGNATTEFDAQRSDIRSSAASNLARMRSNRRATLSDYQYQLGNLNQRAAELAQAQAGTLGFGRKKPKRKAKKRRQP